MWLAFPNGLGSGRAGGSSPESGVEHRSTARSRVVPIVYDAGAPMQGMPVAMGDKHIGIVGSTANGHGLALLRLDKVADALETATPMTAGGVPIRVVKPAWGTFAWPGETKVST